MSAPAAIAWRKQRFGLREPFQLDQQRAEQRAHVDVPRIFLERPAAARLRRRQISRADQGDGLVEDRLRCKQFFHEVR